MPQKKNDERRCNWHFRKRIEREEIEREDLRNGLKYRFDRSSSIETQCGLTASNVFASAL